MYEELKDNNYSFRFIARQIFWLFPSSVRTLIRNILDKPIEPFYQTICAKNLCLKKDTYQFNEINVYAGPMYQFWIDYNPNKIAGRYNVEVRHPFFDKRLFEFMLTVPDYYKKKGDITKYLLKESMKDFLPDEIYYRNDKAEFSEIVAHQYKSLNQENVSFDNVVKCGLISANEIEKLFNVKKLYYRYNTNELNRIWELYLIEKWLIKLKDGR